jgi:hypothetical protein
MGGIRFIGEVFLRVGCALIGFIVFIFATVAEALESWRLFS